MIMPPKSTLPTTATGRSGLLADRLPQDPQPSAEHVPTCPARHALPRRKPQLSPLSLPVQASTAPTPTDMSTITYRPRRPPRPRRPAERTAAAPTAARRAYDRLHAAVRPSRARGAGRPVAGPRAGRPDDQRGWTTRTSPPTWCCGNAAPTRPAASCCRPCTATPSGCGCRSPPGPSRTWSTRCAAPRCGARSATR